MRPPRLPERVPSWGYAGRLGARVVGAAVVAVHVDPPHEGVDQGWSCHWTMPGCNVVALIVVVVVVVVVVAVVEVAVDSECSGWRC